jgi:hypothetical protein
VGSGRCSIPFTGRNYHLSGVTPANHPKLKPSFFIHDTFPNRRVSATQSQEIFGLDKRSGFSRPLGLSFVRLIVRTAAAHLSANEMQDKSVKLSIGGPRYEYQPVDAASSPAGGGNAGHEGLGKDDGEIECNSHAPMMPSHSLAEPRVPQQYTVIAPE